MSHDASIIDLPDRGLVVVTGANGAGKSALVEGIAQALWGKTLRGARWSPWRAGVAGHVSIEADGLRAHRSWTGKAKILAWDVDEVEGAFDTTTKAQESLDAVVGAFDVWRRTCVFSAADAAHFTLASDSERKLLLEETLGLGWFDRALGLARADLRTARLELGQVELEASTVLARATALEEGIAAMRAAGPTEAPDPGALESATARAAQVASHLAQAAAESRTLAARRQALSAAGGRERERADAARARLARLGAGECHACGQAIAEEVRANLRAEIASAIEEARRKETDAAADLAAVQAEEEEHDEEMEALRALHSRLRGEQEAATRAVQAHRRAAGQLAGQEAQLRLCREAMTQHVADLERLRVEVAELASCESILGVRGARARVVGRTLSAVEARTNSWLARMSTAVEVRLRPYTEKKSGGATDSISLSLANAGGEGGYPGASAGERRRVDVAILLALGELAGAARTGARWRSPVFFDECADSLDAEGREAIMELLSDIAVDKCVVLITHDEDLAHARADLRLRVDNGVVSVISSGG